MEVARDDDRTEDCRETDRKRCFLRGGAVSGSLHGGGKKARGGGDADGVISGGFSGNLRIGGGSIRIGL